MTYQAIVTRIKVRPHPNADKLQIGMAANTQVIVGLDTKDGDLGVFFPIDGQLSEEFCQANDLIARYENGKKVGGGFFDEKRRVRAQNFRGVKSEGFWVPMSYFDLWDTSKLIEGYTFDYLYTEEDDSIDGLADVVPICNKYITPQTQAAQKKISAPKISMRKVDMPQHMDTENIRQHIYELRAGDIITITRKLHGTSGRLGFVLVTRPAPNTLWNRLRAFLGYPAKYITYYEYVIGTRRTLLGDFHQGYYGKEEFRRDVVRGVALDKGEIIYFEIVGYTEDGRLIMQEQPIKDKELQKVFGDKMRYTYGCLPNQCKMFVYRITRTDVNGNHIELPWEQVKQRCRQLGLEHVPEISRFIFDFFEDMGQTDKQMHEDVLLGFDHLVNGIEGKEAIFEPLDNSHIQEGIVIRVDGDRGTHFYKLKSWLFGLLEGYIKDDDNYVDTEEAA